MMPVIRRMLITIRQTFRKLLVCKLNKFEKVYFGCLLLILFYIEFFSYWILWLWWPKMNAQTGQTRNEADNSLRLLFVADPQIQGFINERPLLGYFTRWDIDRYLQRTFQQALWFSSPDAVVFLGDLLDEGSIASVDDYALYWRRFDRIFSVPDNIQVIMIPGDNDIGGEGLDPKSPWKEERFRTYSKTKGGDVVPLLQFADILKLNIDFGYEHTNADEGQLREMAHNSTAKFRIVVNHFGILERFRQSVLPVISILKPSIIFTAHSHLAKVFSCKECTANNDNLKQSDLNADKLRLRYPVPYDTIEDSEWHDFQLSNPSSSLKEIGVPTCSYRMGVPTMGYAVASVDSNGLMKYAVLWLPSRYDQLYNDVIVFIFAALGFLMSLVIRLACQSDIVFKIDRE